MNRCQLKGTGADNERKLKDTNDNYISGPKRCPKGRSADNDFRRLLVVGGDTANTRLKMSDSTGDTWRDSLELPYATGITSYGAALFEKDDRIYLTGGFADESLTRTVSNARNIYELIPNSRFKKVAEDDENYGSVAGVGIPSTGPVQWP